MALAQRRRQPRTVALLGATDDQLRRMAVWEAGVVGAAALLVGGAITGFTGVLVRYVPPPRATYPAWPLRTIPWLPLAAIAAT